ncbi:O-methyltransferase [Streptomyces sp. NPDC001601]|uniref:O-methyltransferase n=1 Tax=Streptomyces sp. NPDC001601 TaxID=3364592 RepID=UPI0036906D6E
MDDQPAHVLDDLYQEGRAHDGPPADRLLRLRNMTPDAARLISTLIRPGAPRPSWRSTSNGYSAIWFADALRVTGGRLTTVDTDAARVTAALANLERAGVRGHADVRHADGAETLAAPRTRPSTWSCPTPSDRRTPATGRTCDAFSSRRASSPSTTRSATATRWPPSANCAPRQPSSPSACTRWATGC